MIPMSLKQIAEAIRATVVLPAGYSGGDRSALRVTIDSRDTRVGDMFIAIRGERFDGHRFIDQAVRKGAVACVGCAYGLGEQGPARSVPYLVVSDTVEALGRLASYYRREVMRVSTVVVAVTGSNGKTTTKGMIDQVLGGSLTGRSSPKNFNNHIGVPLTLLSAEADDLYLVCEIGSNAPGEVASLAEIASPEVGVITSIGQAHLQGLRDLAGVAAEKASLLDHVRAGGFAVVNVDHQEIREHLARGRHARVKTFGTDPRAQLWVANRRGTISGTTFELDGRFLVELPMPGVHHAANAVAAFAVGRWFGLAPAKIIERLGSFEPPPGRTRRIEVGGVTVIDDTYNANPASMTAAVRALCDAQSGRRVLVMGDMLELGFGSASLHTEALRVAIDAGIETVVAVGAAMSESAAGLSDQWGTAEVVACKDADAAGEALARMLSPGDTVWIKGSRAVQLDHVVERLRTGFGPQAAVA